MPTTTTVKTTDFIYNKAMEFARKYKDIDAEIWAMFVRSIPVGSLETVLPEWEALARQGRLDFLSEAKAYIGKVAPEVQSLLESEVLSVIEDTTALVDDVIESIKTRIPTFDPPMEPSSAFRFVQNTTDRTYLALSTMEQNAMTPLSKIVPQYDAVFGDVINNTILRSTQGMGVRESAEIAVQKLAKQNIFTVTYKNGAQVPTSSYVEMATRTEMLNIHLETQQSRMKDYGLNLVEVSSHSTSCEQCDPWQGRVYCLSGQDKNHENIDVAIAGGLYHFSCRHMQFPYVEGISEPQDPISKKELDANKDVRKQYTDNQKRIDQKTKDLQVAQHFNDVEEAQKLQTEIDALQAEQATLSQADVLQAKLQQNTK